MTTADTNDSTQPGGLGAMTGSALAEQRNALAEARLRIIARIEDNKRWGDPLDEEAGLQKARRIIGAMWDELPVPTPQAVIDHEAHIRRVIEEQNDDGLGRRTLDADSK